MGVTIHYSGKLDHLNSIDSLREELIDICTAMKWKWNSLDDDWSKSVDATLVHEEENGSIVGHLGLKGISFSPHRDCETVNIFFDSKGLLMSPIGVILTLEGKINCTGTSVKTQFAPLHVHMTLIKLLKYLKKRYISDIDVLDEGGYWEAENEQVLRKRIDRLNRAMDQLDEGLSKLTMKKSTSTSISVREIEKIIRRLLNG